MVLPRCCCCCVRSSGRDGTLFKAAAVLADMTDQLIQIELTPRPNDMERCAEKLVAAAADQHGIDAFDAYCQLAQVDTRDHLKHLCKRWEARRRQGGGGSIDLAEKQAPADPADVPRGQRRRSLCCRLCPSSKTIFNSLTLLNSLLLAMVIVQLTGPAVLSGGSAATAEASEQDTQSAIRITEAITAKPEANATDAEVAAATTALLSDGESEPTAGGGQSDSPNATTLEKADEQKRVLKAVQLLEDLPPSRQRTVLLHIAIMHIHTISKLNETVHTLNASLEAMKASPGSGQEVEQSSTFGKDGLDGRDGVDGRPGRDAEVKCVSTLNLDGNATEISSICPTSGIAATTCKALFDLRMAKSTRNPTGHVDGILDFWRHSGTEESKAFWASGTAYVMFSYLPFWDRPKVDGTIGISRTGAANWKQSGQFVMVKFGNFSTCTSEPCWMWWNFNHRVTEELKVNANSDRLVARLNMGAIAADGPNTAWSSRHFLELRDLVVVHGLKGGFQGGDLRIVPNCFFRHWTLFSGRCAATHRLRSASLGGEGSCYCKAEFDYSTSPPDIVVCNQRYTNIVYQSTPPAVGSTSGDVDVIGPSDLGWDQDRVIEFADGTRIMNPVTFHGDRVSTHQDVYARMCLSGSWFEYDCEAASTQDVVRVKNEVASVQRMLAMYQTQAEARVRASGYSGINQIRAWKSGTEPWHTKSFGGGGVGSFHNHGDFKRVVGMGETGAVLNGVQFWTRHNDYNLNMPSTTSGDYNAVEPVPMPGVPPEVTAKATVAEQITEMQLWFKAFRDQDYSVRDYRKYFKPVLSILEGTWIKQEQDLVDPFASDRHQFASDTWNDLHDKSRFLANSGRKNPQENLPFLPTGVREVLTDPITGSDVPTVANWEYRIICHPLEDDLPLNRFKIIEDLHLQLHKNNPISFAEMAKTDKDARFALNSFDRASWHHGASTWEFIDDIMAQVPGKDNYMGNLTDDASCDQNEDQPLGSFHDFSTLNTAFYNRYYAAQANTPANGRRRRGFFDKMMWVAQTSQDKVSGLSFTPKEGPKKGEQFHQKYSYAFPLEIIYLTPLQTWNPYNLEIKDHTTWNADNNARTGSVDDVSLAWKGVSERGSYYMTPIEFYEGMTETTGADTGMEAKGILDPSDPSVIRKVSGSGVFIASGNIGGGVGKMRLRWPIMPVHEEGSTQWKELKALTRFMKAKGNEADQLAAITQDSFGIEFELTYTNGHHHTCFLSGPDVVDLKEGKKTTVDIISTLQNGHDHTVSVEYDAATEKFKIKSMTNDEPHELVMM